MGCHVTRNKAEQLRLIWFWLVTHNYHFNLKIGIMTLYNLYLISYTKYKKTLKSKCLYILDQLDFDNHQFRATK